MRLFLYGTLLYPPTLAKQSGDPGLPSRCIAATLHGWRRVALNAVPWPTLRRDPNGTVSGIVAHVPTRALAHLTAWEGGTYHLTRVVVTTAWGKTAAHTWIAPGGSRRPWRGSTHAASAARPTRHAGR
jgi:gamma-glutamylcyclotransferase (GGCT)/AIG2-like uncharacterized protein YtfP